MISGTWSVRQLPDGRTEWRYALHDEGHSVLISRSKQEIEDFLDKLEFEQGRQKRKGEKNVGPEQEARGSFGGQR